jgi:hypothetical protein
MGSAMPAMPAMRILCALAALCVAAALAPAALAADGGPSLNIPVPASARTQTAGGTPAATVTAAAPAAPATTATTPSATRAGQATVPASTTSVPAAPTGLGTTIGTVVLRSAPAARGRGGLSDAAIAAAVLGGLLALACLAWAIARSTAYEPRWTLSLRHSMAEAGDRASATWAELGDWIRLGR